MKLTPNINKIYLIFPLGLFTLFIVFFITNFLFEIWVYQNKILNPPIKLQSDFKYPVLKSVYKPTISAKGAIVMDADSKIVLYSKNPDLRFSSASTTKIMTALVASEYFKPTDILTVKNSSSEGVHIGLLQGEAYNFNSLLYAMLLPSANDAALAISENYPGGEKEFVKQMNIKSGSLRLSNTHYGDASGLFDKENYTTPFDLARLASYAVQSQIIKDAVATKEKIISDISGSRVYYLNNLNKLLGIDGVNGVKTGYTEEAGQVLVTSKDEKGKTIIIVVMGSENRFEDTEKLLNLISGNITFLSIHP